VPPRTKPKLASLAASVARLPYLLDADWNKRLPLGALVPLETVMGVAMIFWGIPAIWFCSLIACCHVVAAFEKREYCVWKSSSRAVPRWVGLTSLIVLGCLWATVGVLLGYRDPLLTIFGKG
jgi:hypothetical protein